MGEKELERIQQFLNDPLHLALIAAVLAALLWIVFRSIANRKKPPERTSVEAPAQVAAPSELGDVAEIKALDQKGWLLKLRNGLSKTRTSFQQSLEGLFTQKKVLDSETLDKLHEALFRSDIGVATADKLIDHLKASLKGESTQNTSWETVRKQLHDVSLGLLNQTDHKVPLPSASPLVILVVGVNGVGKTTSIGKLAAHFLAQQKKVLLCAADTFRAAAIDQLKVWGERLDVNVIAHQPGADPAAVAYDGVKAAIARGVDVLLVDTAGRLHSKVDLMSELNKINRVLGKDLPGAPHETWLVVDATTGQNAFQQVKAFKEVVKLSGLVVTKLDGTAKGGVIIGICDQFQLPIRFIGVGEKASDLRSFDAQDYVDSLWG